MENRENPFKIKLHKMRSHILLQLCFTRKCQIVLIEEFLQNVKDNFELLQVFTIVST